MKLSEVSDAAIDWTDRAQVRQLIFSVRTDEPMKLGHAQEAVAHIRGYKTYNDMHQALWRDDDENE